MTSQNICCERAVSSRCVIVGYGQTGVFRVAAAVPEEVIEDHDGIQRGHKSLFKGVSAIFFSFFKVCQQGCENLHFYFLLHIGCSEAYPFLMHNLLYKLLLYGPCERKY